MKQLTECSSYGSVACG